MISYKYKSPNYNDRVKNSKIEFIIINCKPNRPLNPSIKFAPLIMNKKHKTININENAV